jgi:hypothetical protein
MITIMVAGTVIQWTRQGRLPRFPASLDFGKGKADVGSGSASRFFGFYFPYMYHAQSNLMSFGLAGP